MRIQGQAGFTLLELMVAITVLGILLAIGAPSFTRMIRDNRVAAQTNDLITALTVARSEATKRGTSVSVCAAGNNPPTVCGAANNASWQLGWIIFADRVTPGVIDVDTDIIQTFVRASPAVNVTTNNVGFIQFDSTGLRSRLTPSPGPGIDEIVFSLQHDPCADNQHRTITIALSGRASAAKAACL